MRITALQDSKNCVRNGKRPIQISRRNKAAHDDDEASMSFVGVATVGEGHLSLLTAVSMLKSDDLKA